MFHFLVYYSSTSSYFQTETPSPSILRFPVWRSMDTFGLNGDKVRLQLDGLGKIEKLMDG
jgi:hypothetical protein